MLCEWCSPSGISQYCRRGSSKADPQNDAQDGHHNSFTTDRNTSAPRPRQELRTGRSEMLAGERVGFRHRHGSGAGGDARLSGLRRFPWKASRTSSAGSTWRVMKSLSRASSCAARGDGPSPARILLRGGNHQKLAHRTAAATPQGSTALALTLGKLIIILYDIYINHIYIYINHIYVNHMQSNTALENQFAGNVPTAECERNCRGMHANWGKTPYCFCDHVLHAV